MSLLIASAALALIVADPPLQKEVEETRGQLIAIETQIEEAKLRVPFGADAAATEAALRAEAKDAGLSRIEVAFATAENEAIDGVELRRIDVSGRDSYQKLQQFLHRITLFGAVGIDRLNMDAAPGGVVAFSARIVYPVFPARSVVPLTKKPASSSDDVYRQILAAESEMLQRERTALASFNRIVARFNGANMINALAAVAHALETSAVAMTSIRAGAPTTFTGMALGLKHVDAVRAALQKSGFEIENLNVNPAGGCSAFTATARLTAKEQASEVVLDNGIFDEGAAAICKTKSLVPSDIAVRREDAGGITLRLRDADAGTLFNALHDVSSENFVVDGGIDRRFNVTAEKATVPEILKQLRGSGLTISDGHVHRVGSSEPAVKFRGQKWEGEPVTLLLHDASLPDIMCLFHEITQMNVRLQRDASVRVSVFLKDVRWDEAMANLIATAGQRYKIVEDKIYVGPKGVVDAAAVDACELAHAVTTDRQWAARPQRLDDVSATDLTLAGVAGAKGSWKAYTFGPLKKVWILEPGTRLHESTVQSVGPDGATLKTDAGQIVELRLK